MVNAVRLPACLKLWLQGTEASMAGLHETSCELRPAGGFCHSICYAPCYIYSWSRIAICSEVPAQVGPRDFDVCGEGVQG